MKYRKCGKSGLWLSEIGLGLWKWGDPDYDGSRIGEHEGFKVLDRALELGVTHWDTANSYNAGAGNSERLLGKYFSSRGKSVRDMVVLATKIRNSVRDEHEISRDFSPNETGASRKYIIQAVDDCLRRMNTDYIDIMYHHAPNLSKDGSWETPLEETWTAFEDLVRQGKILYLMVSNRSKGQLEEENAALKQVSAGRSWLIGVQNRYNLVDRDKVASGGGSEGDFLDYIGKDGIGLIPLVPLAVGLLTGRYRKNKKDESGRLSNSSDKFWADQYFTDKNMDIIERLAEMAEEKKCSMARLAIAWLLKHEEIPSVIAGVTKMEQLEDNAGAVEVDISDKEMDELDKMTRPE